jgi:hypothetical protein
MRRSEGRNTNVLPCQSHTHTHTHLSLDPRLIHLLNIPAQSGPSRHGATISHSQHLDPPQTRQNKTRQKTRQASAGSSRQLELFSTCSAAGNGQHGLRSGSAWCETSPPEKEEGRKSSSLTSHKYRKYCKHHLVDERTDIESGSEWPGQ